MTSFARTTLAGIAVAGFFGLTAIAQAAPPERLRGTIESVEPNALTLTTRDGKTERVALADDAKVSWVIPASLDQIKEGTFIGTATKGENPMTALEVVLFPEAMRGTGEGQYPWDEIADTTAAGGSKVKSAMTNGTVKAETTGSAAHPKVKSAMTNGTVKAEAGKDGTKTLTVNYGGQSSTILVPPSAPVVTFEPTGRNALSKGAKVFVVATRTDGNLTATRVAVGKDGLTPPM
ncbi:metal ABC transporter permease [Methylobacterium sp. SD21]|uniref:metal ABC transporter permease n=1 Tax=Methylobacterium litchii TaxID=3138810 RepID=UPI00313EAF68